MHLQQKQTGGPRKVAMLMVSGETMKKIDGLHESEYAALIPATLFVTDQTMHGVAITCEGNRVLFTMPVDLFKEVTIQEHIVV